MMKLIKFEETEFRDKIFFIEIVPFIDYLYIIYELQIDSYNRSWYH